MMPLSKELGFQNLNWIPVFRPLSVVKGLSIVVMSLSIIFLILIFLGWNQINWQDGRLQSFSGFGFWASTLIFPIVFFSFFSVIAYFSSVWAIAIEENMIFVKYSWNRIKGILWTDVQELKADLWRKELIDNTGISSKVAWMGIKLGQKNWLSIIIDISTAEKIVTIYEKKTGRKFVGNLRPLDPFKSL
jgi:hypothetical protein